MRQALEHLSADSVKISSVSPFYTTPCFPPGAGPDYVNACALLETTLSAPALLAHLHAAEAHFGRERRVRWAARTLDLDLLFLGDRVLPDVDGHTAWREMAVEDQKTRAPGELILPHPRLQDRAFVLVPLADIAPDWVHPVTGMRVSQMLSQLCAAERDEIRHLAD